jgi:hypothetical protein
MPIQRSLVTRIIDSLRARWAEELAAMPPEAMAAWGEDASSIEDGGGYDMIETNDIPECIRGDYEGWDISGRLSTKYARSFGLK